MNDREKAIGLLRGDVTCALCKGDRAFTTVERGVKPLLKLLQSGENYAGFAAADKVVGKAAAFLYALLQVDYVYAHVISAPALRTLERLGISVAYAQQVPAIRNRAGTGFCPMETAVWNVDDPHIAYDILKRKTSV